MNRGSLILTGLLTGLALLLPGVAQARTGPTHTIPAHTIDPEAWRSTPPENPGVVLVRGATVWTQGPDGILEDADLLVRDGRIEAVGQGLDAPGDALVVDAAGKHVTPGLIDAHSHIAIDGEVNESTHIVTAEVRIRDVLDPGHIAIYRQLAGGLTSANILHGSANAIGGQNAVIKMRWGADADGLLFEGAPSGIKFALGENPKRSNFRRPGPPRFPTTRPGVEQAIRQALDDARAYREAWETYRQADDRATRVPPRRDVQMEALLEVLSGDRLVHAHSYRADEILMLLGVAESFGFRIATLQHVLEGYKVADEIAAHGAGASTFTDWWAYKYEVIDAIPYNGALMHERGVVVSFNSDSDELGRRMQLEAAKAVRYGGVDRAEALDFVTLNPARQLGIEDRVGSLEAGKDADFVIWSGDPLSTASRCDETWIDGRKYFDRQEHLAAWKELEAEREALLAKVRAATPPDEPPADAGAGEDAMGSEEGMEVNPGEELEIPDNVQPPEDLEGSNPPRQETPAPQEAPSQQESNPEANPPPSSQPREVH
ncbi:MAG: amidohydrolase family protein [Acidobacteriota bacterium]|nr:amidohydrolase family protein [Acidobacteriota bacterium]